MESEEAERQEVVATPPPTANVLHETRVERLITQNVDTIPVECAVGQSPAGEGGEGREMRGAVDGRLIVEAGLSRITDQSTDISSLMVV